jgi:PhnB protein
MSIMTTTHLNFRGEARAALEFYRSVFGGSTTIATYGDLGMPAEAPGAQRIVFGQLEAVDGFRVMAYDIPDEPGATGEPGTPRTPSAMTVARPVTVREQGVTITDQPFFVSVRGDRVDEVEAYWAELSVGASVIEPFAASAWSPGFGMLTDRFGVTWILDVALAVPADVAPEHANAG